MLSGYSLEAIIAILSVFSLVGATFYWTRVVNSLLRQLDSLEDE